MPKSFLRIVTLLLVPCLTAGPCPKVFGSTQLPPVNVSENLYQAEALQVRFAQAFHDARSIACKLLGLEREALLTDFKGFVKGGSVSAATFESQKPTYRTHDVTAQFSGEMEALLSEFLSTILTDPITKEPVALQPDERAKLETLQKTLSGKRIYGIHSIITMKGPGPEEDYFFDEHSDSEIFIPMDYIERLRLMHPNVLNEFLLHVVICPAVSHPRAKELTRLSYYESNYRYIEGTHKGGRLGLAFREAIDNPDSLKKYAQFAAVLPKTPVPIVAPTPAALSHAVIVRPPGPPVDRTSDQPVAGPLSIRDPVVVSPMPVRVESRSPVSALPPAERIEKKIEAALQQIFLWVWNNPGHGPALLIDEGPAGDAMLERLKDKLSKLSYQKNGSPVVFQCKTTEYFFEFATRVKSEEESSHHNKLHFVLWDELSEDRADDRRLQTQRWRVFNYERNPRIRIMLITRDRNLYLRLVKDSEIIRENTEHLDLRQERLAREVLPQSVMATTEINQADKTVFYAGDGVNVESGAPVTILNEPVVDPAVGDIVASLEGRKINYLFLPVLSADDQVRVEKWLANPGELTWPLARAWRYLEAARIIREKNPSFEIIAAGPSHEQLAHWPKEMQPFSWIGPERGDDEVAELYAQDIAPRIKEYMQTKTGQFYIVIENKGQIEPFLTAFNSVPIIDEEPVRSDLAHWFDGTLLEIPWHVLMVLFFVTWPHEEAHYQAAKLQAVWGSDQKPQATLWDRIYRGQIRNGVHGRALLTGPFANLFLGLAGLAVFRARLHANLGIDFWIGYLSLFVVLHLLAVFASHSDFRKFRTEQLYGQSA